MRRVSRQKARGRVFFVHVSSAKRAENNGTRLPGTREQGCRGLHTHGVAVCRSLCPLVGRSIRLAVRLHQLPHSYT